MAATNFRAVITENFERRASAEPCVSDETGEVFTCPGSGVVPGCGRVTSSVQFALVGDEVTITRTLTFGDGSTLVTSEVYNSHQTPGNSTNAPGALHSFGNPALDCGTWEVIGGSGMFASASGEGTVCNVIGGDVIRIKMTGDVTL
jgi:hypothetical protein